MSDPSVKAKSNQPTVHIYGKECSIERTVGYELWCTEVGFFFLPICDNFNLISLVSSAFHVCAETIDYKCDIWTKKKTFELGRHVPQYTGQLMTLGLQTCQTVIIKKQSFTRNIKKKKVLHELPTAPVPTPLNWPLEWIYSRKVEIVH